MIQMTLVTKQEHTHRHRDKTCGCQGEGEVGEGWTGSLRSADSSYHI